jgi:hypothetical protein
MKKLTFITLIGAVLILSGCTADNTTLNNNLDPNQVVNENKNTNATETNTNTIVPTDLKTYTNKKHNYSFQYPKDWTLGDSPNTSIPDLTADDVAFDGPEYLGLRFGVRVLTTSDCATLRACTENNRLSFGTDEKTTGLSETMVGGKPALTETITRPTSGNWKHYVSYVLYKEKLYRFFTIAQITNDTATKPTINKILSTVKFLE